MSRREKSTVLFSRNGIKIEKIEFLDMTKPANQKDVGIMRTNKIVQKLKNKDKNVIISGKPAWDEVIKHESPLGFYYYQTIHHKREEAKVIEPKYGSATYKTFIFKFNNIRYELSYPIECGDIRINKETRPWDILPGTTGIEDHFVQDLFKEVNKFFSICEDQKIIYKKSDGRSYWSNNRRVEELPVYSKDPQWVTIMRKEVYNDLFGDENGPSINYNDIKILSHGFDLKESFRKRKEVK